MFTHPALRLLRFRPPAALTTTTTTAATTIATTNFSTSAPAQFPGRITRDRNRNRGVSAVHRQPHKGSVSVGKYPLPQPVLDPKERTPVETDEDHGLWAFFENKTPLPTPDDDHKCGRAWSVDELRLKSWEDLHRLWWKCVLERNKQETQALERKRLEPGYGDYEAGLRKDAVKKTMRGIKHVLTERYYSWEDARVRAESDPEIDLSGNGPVYTPRSDLEKKIPDGSQLSEAAQAPPTKIQAEKSA